MIDADRLKQLLTYDPETGEFHWLTSRGGWGAGSVAGCTNPRGYRVIGIDCRSYLGHRLAWLYMTGEWPAEEVDHINGVPGDDRWENLRESRHAENQRNSRKRRDNTSGIKGVSWVKKRSRWLAQIQVDGHTKNLGYFTDINEAATAYAEASKKYHGAYGRLA